jgi:L-seryl-tRNA(Ser) seleniumtransferase
MKTKDARQALLRKIPAVDKFLVISEADPFFKDIPRSVVLNSIRDVTDGIRKKILDSDPDISGRLSSNFVTEEVKKKVLLSMRPNLRRVVNATGVVIHTNLGRSLLPRKAIENLIEIAANYSNLEFDLDEGKRGSRYRAVEDLLCELSGAESALVVNNNAAAVLLCLETIACGKKVIVSRGELVEIGGSFRIPDVMQKSGAFLKEVGTTNRTHVFDYENAVENETGLLLKVHTSNYSIVGFKAEVTLEELVLLGKKYHIPVMEDLGSGTLVDFSEFGLTKEPTVQDSVKAGADIITFSGDKLLGGPQAGIIVGTKEVIDKIKRNPLNRALRIDKLTLAALESTLRIYRDPEKFIKDIPTLYMLTMPFEKIEKKASDLLNLLENIDDPRLNVKMLNLSSKAGGGSLPMLELPSKCIGIKIRGMSENAVESFLRNATPPVIGRIENDMFILDLRTVLDDELEIIKNSLSACLNRIA